MRGFGGSASRWTRCWRCEAGAASSARGRLDADAEAEGFGEDVGLSLGGAAFGACVVCGGWGGLRGEAEGSRIVRGEDVADEGGVGAVEAVGDAEDSGEKPDEVLLWVGEGCEEAV